MIIYKTTNLINGKIYIGQDRNNNSNYIGSGKILYLAIQKYGLENFNKEILEECNSLELLNEREKYWIDFYKSTNRSVEYNITKGGTGGDTLSNNPNKKQIGEKISNSNKKIWSDSTYKKKMSELRKTQITRETRQKISDSTKGKNNRMYGKSHQQCSKDKMSNARKIWWINLPEEKKKELGEKISKTNTGRHGNIWTDEQKKSHSKLMKEKNPFKGKTHTDEVKKKISDANKKPKSKEHKQKISETLKGNKPGNMRQITIENIIYESLTEASRQLNLPLSTVKNRLKSNSIKFKNWNYE